MGRKKVLNKNTVRSVSVQSHQADFIDQHPKFDFSKFVQIHLEEYLNLALEVEDIENEYRMKKEDDIK